MPDALPVLKSRNSQDQSARRPKRLPSQSAELRPQVSRTSSVSSTASSIPPPPPRSRQPSTATIEQNQPAPKVVVPSEQEVLKSTMEVLDRCNLSPQEISQSKTRLARLVPGLATIHLNVLHQAVTSQNAESAKALLVQHSMTHSGISSWIIPIRRAIEAGGM